MRTRSLTMKILTLDSPHSMISRLIYWLLGLPPAINFLELKPFDNTPPKVEVHEKNIPASIISLMIAVMIVLFMTQTSVLQDASATTQASTASLADFMSEDPFFEMLIRAIGFAVNLIAFWVIPLSAFLIAATRSVLEAFPDLKNHSRLDPEE